GAKLAKITQALAYQHVKNISHLTQRTTTKNNLDMARYQYASKEASKNVESDETIWKGCRRKEIQRTIQQFLFKAIHGTHNI
ncbi:hypothetical protein DFJ58DRAFT_660328, partial [Suillus subalutaceus]|uniref:uncharacterized protein n=1 Tax=Suillus subalutaceus TaxID=48586 RepID=UPI001B85E936